MEYVVSKFDEYATLLVRMIADDHDYGHSFVDDKYTGHDYYNNKNVDDGDYDDYSWVKIDTHLECTFVD